MSQKFKRLIEDFICEHCGKSVEGNGYTNHCPDCLWSKHVDNYPGDRSNDCKGMMEPIGVDYKGGEYTLIHKCQVCGEEKRNKTTPNDNIDSVSRI